MDARPSVVARLRSVLRARPGASAAGGVVLLVTVVALVVTATTSSAGVGQWHDPVAAGPSAAASASAAAPTGGKTISLSATGDIVMGDAPGKLPPNDGRGYFDKVKSLLPADVVMGNLEQPITDETGTGKCPKPAANPSPASPAPGASPSPKNNCHQFRVPPSYAGHLKDAGFSLLNMANNHGKDYGNAGYANTQQSLEKFGLKHTGETNEITIVQVDGVKIAVLGFSSYSGNNSLLNLTSAKKVVSQAAAQADIVVVQVHMGAEGGDKSHVRPGTEFFLGENRGDPMKFARAVIDAGADLIIGHGPHVVRGLEFYKGRLIAYSLGNFAGGGALSSGDRVGWGGVLTVSLKPDGSFASGRFRSTYFSGSYGIPQPDKDERALKLMKQMTEQDFGANGARVSADGSIAAPAT
ncbi:CapA family protein [Catellatospora sp. TT07R-123]|uniref:CapA family protein n=1 Tax=Catellatospora sp. TT07R-123 TaxID=2733863 RepID=UPI001BB44AF6|nr:CapA family protein [Catellatospora sp. TT07R-123]